jgi:hypothetical protein
MDYTTSDAYATNVGTGHRLHQDTAPITTVVSAKDMNMVIWGLMKLLEDAGISAAAFDPETPATYNRISLAVQALAGVALSAFTGANQSLSTSGYQKFPGGLILQWGSVSVGDVPAGFQAYAVTFPIAFPTALFRVFPGVKNTTAYSNLVGGYQNETTSGCDLIVQETASVVQAATLVYFAIGK